MLETQPGVYEFAGGGSYTGLAQDVSNGKHGCVVVWQGSYTTVLATATELGVLILLKLTDTLSLLEGSMKGDDLGPISYSIE
jgi:hypothetical protein